MKIILKAIVLILLTTGITMPARPQTAKDSIVDGVVAIVGANVILRSDIENQYLQFRAQGNIQGSAEKVRCQIIEGLLFQKLLYHRIAGRWRNGPPDANVH